MLTNSRMEQDGLTFSMSVFQEPRPSKGSTVPPWRAPVSRNVVAVVENWGLALCSIHRPVDGLNRHITVRQVPLSTQAGMVPPRAAGTGRRTFIVAPAA